MPDFQEEYRKKLISADEAAGLVTSGMWVDYGAICGFPSLIDEKLGHRAGELRDVKIRAEHSHTQIPRFDPRQEHFIFNSWFLGQVERRFHQAGACSYIPYSLNEGPRMYRERLKDEVDIAFIQVTPMDENGFFNFGTAIMYQKALCDVARCVVLEVNPNQPWVYGGYDECVHISAVNHIVENFEYKVPEFAAAPAADVDEQISQFVVELIEDGSTIQLGIGPLPGMIGELLIKQGKRDLGIHSEMFNDSMMDLIEAGVVNGTGKKIDVGKAVFCFAAGTEKLYRFMDRNPVLAGYPSEYSNNPAVIARNEKQVAVNSALKVDLRGQICSESVGCRQISGTGGQLDFTRGAYMSPGGQAFICLPATRRDENGALISNIVPTLTLGDMVTVPASEVSHVVTEYGVVNLKGKTTWQRAGLMISLAHPDFRDELKEAAINLNIVPRGATGLL